MKIIMGKCKLAFTMSLLLFAASQLSAQNEVPQQDSADLVLSIKRGSVKDTAFENYASGEFTPGRGFDMVRSKYGTLNLSLYAIARYLNKLPGHQTWQDHLGRDKNFTGRKDFFWHRTMIWFSGWLGTPKLTSVATVWTVFTTEQALIYGNIAYKFNKHFQVAMGVGPNLSVRSMQGSFPFYSSTDRTMGEE